MDLRLSRSGPAMLLLIVVLVACDPNPVGSPSPTRLARPPAQALPVAIATATPTVTMTPPGAIFSPILPTSPLPTATEDPFFSPISPLPTPTPSPPVATQPAPTGTVSPVPTKPPPPPGLPTPTGSPRPRPTRTVTLVVTVVKTVVPVPIVTTRPPPPPFTATPDKPHPSVTGGGWIPSPAGAYAIDPASGGKANFGFVVRARKGADTPTGHLDFHLNAAKLKFHGASFDSFEVEGDRATFRGVGTLKSAGPKGSADGDGDRGNPDSKKECGFLITVVDGQLGGTEGRDLFRIKIWDLERENTVVYDSQMGDADDADPSLELGGGSIVIHATGD
ncbi:MAG: hypothetical protein PVF77_03170 [Anaerolineae bacterium]